MTSTETLEKIRNYILNGDHKDGIIAPILNWCDQALESPKTRKDNMQKMREALETLLNLAYEVQDANSEYGPKISVPAQFIIDVAKSALSAPRNCDVGTVEEQYKRFKKFCFDNMGDGMNEPRCSKCPVGKSKTSCKFDWMQMPL